MERTGASIILLQKDEADANRAARVGDGRRALSPVQAEHSSADCLRSQQLWIRFSL